jgi:hypothetical protein
VYFRVVDLIKTLDRTTDGKTYSLIKESLYRLRGCLIQYQLSFKDINNGGEFISLRNQTILSDLLIVEPRKETEHSTQAAFEGLTYAELDLLVVGNLIGNYTRPVSIELLQSLTEKGILFESYINSVMYRQKKIRKDVFILWEDLGLSTKGVNYGSQLASRMRKDLDKIVKSKSSLLGSYNFEKSKTRARSQNLVIERKKNADLSAPSRIYRKLDDPRERYEAGKQADRDKLVEWMRFELRDESDNYANLRAIAAKMPEGLIRVTVHEAFAYYRDGQTKNPTAYFVGIMRRLARERGVDLGLPESGKQSGGPAAKRAEPKPISMRRKGKGLSSIADLTNRWEQGPDSQD